MKSTTFTSRISAVFLICFVATSPILTAQSGIVSDDDPTLDERNSRAIICTINYLDSYVCLSPLQQEALYKLMQEDWRSEKNFHAKIMCQNGYFPTPFAFEDNDIAKVLNERQFERFKNFGEETTFGLANELEAMRNDQAEEVILGQKIRDIYDEAGTFLLDEVNQICELSDDQTSQLEIALKGVTVQLMRRRALLVDEFNKDNEGVREIASEILATGPCVQIRYSGLWQKRIKKTLAAEQLQKLHSNEQFRIKKTARCCAASLSLTFERSKRLSATDYQSLTSLFETEITEALNERLEQGESTSYSDGVRAVASLPLEKFQDALNAKSFNDASQSIDKLKAYLEAYNSKSKTVYGT